MQVDSCLLSVTLVQQYSLAEGFCPHDPRRMTISKLN
jgi:hypothetical protein